MSKEGSCHLGGLHLKCWGEQPGCVFIGSFLLCTVTTVSYRISSSIETEQGLVADVLCAPVGLLDRWLMWHRHVVCLPTLQAGMTSSQEFVVSCITQPISYYSYYLTPPSDWLHGHSAVWWPSLEVTPGTEVTQRHLTYFNLHVILALITKPSQRKKILNQQTRKKKKVQPD